MVPTLQEEPAPDGCKVIHGRISYVQPMFISGHYTEYDDYKKVKIPTMFQFQFVVVRDRSGERYVLINPGTKLVEPTDARIVYEPRNDPLNRGILMKDIADASVRADNDSALFAWNYEADQQHGRVQADGIIKSLEHAIQIGTWRAD